MVKKLLSLYLLALPLQSQIIDTFSDNNLNANPPWYGDTNRFFINAQNQLQSNGLAQTDTLYIYTPNPYLKNTEWRFWIRLAFNPSSFNYVQIYLATSDSNTKKGAKGYLIYLGGTNDIIALQRQDSLNKTTLITTPNGYLNNNDNIMAIRVFRDSLGNWQLWIDSAATGTYTYIGNAYDTTYQNTQYFGIFFRHTSTRRQSLYFDDLYIGPPIQDTLPPTLTQFNILNSTLLQLQFSERLDTVFAKNPNNYQITTIGTPIQVLLTDLKTIQLKLPSALQDQVTYQLSFQVQDTAGNLLQDTITFTYYRPYPARFRDVRINELLADPTPAVGLPQAEFIELYNTRDVAISLKGWQLKDPKTTATFPDVLILPKEYVIVCDEQDSALWAPWGKTIPLKNFPTLNNTQDSLWLLDSTGTLIDYVFYDQSWYQDPTKSNGGWSLELIDPYVPCEGIANWIASKAPEGGTPAKTNSWFQQFPNPNPPKILQANPITNNQIQLIFDKPVDSTTAFNPTNFQWNPSSITIAQVIPSPTMDTLLLLLATPLDSNQVYYLTIVSFSDCAGHTDSNQTVVIIIPASAQPQDIIINEILFDPYPNHKRYVELYNRSSKIINLAHWLLARGVDSAYSFRLITDSAFYLFPYQHIALSEDTQDVKSVYLPPDTARFLQTAEALPAYAANEDGVWLLNPDSMVIDYLHYLDDWHFPDIKDKEGIALERICSDCATNNPAHWQSASYTVRFGTPGYPNSQRIDLNASISKEVQLQTNRISPDNDGYEDVLVIQYRFTKPYKVNGYIFNRDGVLVHQFLENFFVGTKEGTWYWNGTDSNGNLLPSGPYILLIEALQPEDGEVKYFRFPIVITYQ